MPSKSSIHRSSVGRSKPYRTFEFGQHKKRAISNAMLDQGVIHLSEQKEAGNDYDELHFISKNNEAFRARTVQSFSFIKKIQRTGLLLQGEAFHIVKILSSAV